MNTQSGDIMARVKSGNAENTTAINYTNIGVFILKVNVYYKRCNNEWMVLLMQCVQLCTLYQQHGFVCTIVDAVGGI